MHYFYSMLSSQEICAKIDAVTADDLMTVARRALATPPTISVVGSDLEGVPTHADVCSWFRPAAPPGGGKGTAA